MPSPVSYNLIARCSYASHDSSDWRGILPFKPVVHVDGQELSATQVVNLLSATITTERLQRIEQVVANRTYDIVPVVEGLYDMGNLAAVCRSADALGYGAMHVITSGDKYKKSRRTSAGADKWLHVTAHENTASCMAALKAAGFQVVVTHLGPSSVSIQDVDWTRPTAVVLGNEAAGVSPEAVAAADACAIIPMAGFVESFNISVAAALVLYEARRRRTELLGRSGDLSPEEQAALKAHLILRAMKNSDTVLKALLTRPPPAWQSHHFRRAQLAASSKAHAEAPVAEAPEAAASAAPEAAAAAEEPVAEQTPLSRL